MLRISVREFRVIVERVLIGAGLPLPALPAAREMVLNLQIAHGTGLSLLREHIATALSSPQTALTVVKEGPGLAVLDGGLLSSLVVGPAALDIACSQAYDAGIGAVLLCNTRGGSLLPGLNLTAAQRQMLCLIIGADQAALGFPWGAVQAIGGPGLDERLPSMLEALAHGAGQAYGPDRTLLVCIDASGRGHQPWLSDASLASLVGGVELARATRDALEIEDGLWWWAFELSNEILSPVTAVSRMDAGPPPGEE